jgi:hypothetical protein
MRNANYINGYYGGYYAVLGHSIGDSDEGGNAADCLYSEEPRINEIRQQEESLKQHHESGSGTSVQWANKRLGNKMAGKASTAGPGDDLDSTEDDLDGPSIHRRYFHYGSWSSADRFRSTVRCEELQMKLRSHLRKLSVDRQSARVRFLRLLRQIYPTIILRSIPRWIRIRRELEKAWKKAGHQARGGARKASPPTGPKGNSRSTPTSWTLYRIATTVRKTLARGGGVAAFSTSVPSW